MTDMTPSGKNGKVWLAIGEGGVWMFNTDFILRSSIPHSTVAFLSESTLELRVCLTVLVLI